MSETAAVLSALDEGVKAVVWASHLAGTLGRLSPYVRTPPPADFERAYLTREAARADAIDTTGLLTRRDIAAQLDLAKSSVAQRLRNAKIKPKLVVSKVSYYSHADVALIADPDAVAA